MTYFSQNASSLNSEARPQHLADRLHPKEKEKMHFEEFWAPSEESYKKYKFIILSAGAKGRMNMKQLTAAACVCFICLTSGVQPSQEIWGGEISSA